MYTVLYICYSEVGRGKTLFRLLCRDAGGESEQMLLSENVPQWVVDVLVHVSTVWYTYHGNCVHLQISKLFLVYVSSGKMYRILNGFE